MSATTLDKYQRVVPPFVKPENPNEFRIKSKGQMRFYVSAITNRLNNAADPVSGEQDSRQDEEAPAPVSNQVVLNGMGRTISKVVTIAEIIKRKIPSLHQLTSIKTVTLEDVYLPLEEGLEKVTVQRQIAFISITLSTSAPSAESIASAGYQPPLTEEERQQTPVQEADAKKKEGHKRRNNRHRGSNTPAEGRPAPGTDAAPSNEAKPDAESAEAASSSGGQRGGRGRRPARRGSRRSKGGPGREQTGESQATPEVPADSA